MPTSDRPAALQLVQHPSDHRADVLRPGRLGPADSAAAFHKRCRVGAATIFGNFIVARGASNVEIAETMRTGERLIRDYRSVEPGRKPLGARHFLALPKRLSLALLDDFRTAILLGSFGHE
jgi:hypothetical protein